MRMFGGERMKTVVDKLGVAEDDPIESGMVSKSIENAQKKVEGRNFSIRKYVLQYDNVMWAFEKWGFKKSVCFGCVLMALSAIMRGILGGSFGGLIAATVGFSFAQPFILNSPGLVAGRWFPENERATANSVALLAGYVGMCGGLLVTPILMSVTSIKGILMLYGWISVAGAVLFALFVKDRPATPPCAEQEAERSDFGTGMKNAFKQRNFILCLLIFFAMLGVFNTFFTDIEALIQTLGGKGIDSTHEGKV